ncbi:MAG: ABC transporter permease, partial [Acidobacteria bacterium]|nr:ABC transporter permease [Acidobacteriota bacterium]
NAYQRPDGTLASSFSYPAYQYLRDRATTISGLICFGGPQTVNVGIPGRAESATALLVSGNYFRGLGVQAALGRTIAPNDDRPGEAASVAMVSYGFWQRALGADSSVLGKTIAMNGLPVTIVGVTPREFQTINPDWHVDLMVPMAMQPVVTGGGDVLQNSRYWSFLVFGRLKPGATEEQARVEADTLLRQAILADPPDMAYDLPKVTLEPSGSGFRSFDAMSPALLMLAVVGLILLIACANIAGLLLARATARRREIGTRLSLGAPRGRLIRQLITESLLLSVFGGIIGVAAAFAMSSSPQLPDFRVLAFSAALSIVTGIIFGLAPAVQATRVELLTMLKQTSGSSGRSSRFRSGKALVALQVALSLILLIGAGLFLRTLFNLKTQSFGFQPDNLLVFRMNPSLNGYKDDRLMNFYEAAVKGIQSLPGVESASISRWGILTFASSGERVCFPGGGRGGASTHPIAPRYFATMRIPLLTGRDVDFRDRQNAPRVVLVNEAFAKRFYGGANPVGRSFRIPCSETEQGNDVEIIGMAADTKYFSIRAPAAPAVYIPYRQGSERWMTFAVRATEDPAALLPSIRDTLASLDPNLPIYDVGTQMDWIDRNVAQERRFAVLLALFGAIAILLACSGIYGTLAYLANRRTSEIGVRMALGAGRQHVIRMVVGESLVPVLIGVVLGLGGAFALTRLVRSMLFGVQPTDPATMILAALFLLLTAAFAAFLPARRASRIDPIAALRYE